MINTFKKTILGAGLLLMSMQVFAWGSPIIIPDVGEARIRVVGQNAHNYLSDLTASNADAKTEADFQKKTEKMANVFVALEADIIAMCEVQEDDQILGYITSAMNTILGSNVYTYVTDGMQGSKSSSGYMPVKSGYIYRSDKIATVGGNSSPYTTWNYKPRMRIQAFKEIATNEVFVLSMNHFKAKEGTTPDPSDETRMENATRLVNGLTWVTADPDILIMGDLNAMTEEEPIQKIINAGYAEQLVRFDSTAYSYVYHNKEQLIDHVMANSTMAGQITGAYVYHINNDPTLQSSAMRKKYNYSDHDACLVGLCLGANGCKGEGFDYSISVGGEVRAKKTIENGRLVLTLPDGSMYNVTGVRIR